MVEIKDRDCYIVGSVRSPIGRGEYLTEYFSLSNRLTLLAGYPNGALQGIKVSRYAIHLNLNSIAYILYSL